ncbi:carboxylesterase/lipase family protein [Mumia sp. DW29H23]|uniref:carboxylesterase/lipase family protein n=1 Tax=Mumia sp. DW29H23 TaxID=3421241 RepID=UPI003D681C54
MPHTEEPLTKKGQRTGVRAWALILILVGVVVGFCVDTVVPGPAHGSTSTTHAAPVVRVDGGAVRGTAHDGVEEFRGVPYAAPPLGALRWRAPRTVAPWHGVRDATTFPPVCPQAPPSPNGQSEDCLYVNVTAPTGSARPHGARPVLVWLHGGGYSSGEGADYDPTKLAAEGTVVVTINYRLGLLGFLAHPALAEHRGGASGNYGLMDQQAALRWVRHNIAQFGGDPRNVTIAGQSAGGLSVLNQLASPGARGLFQRAIVESGSFAPKQRTLKDGEAEGKVLAAAAGCPDQTASCLRALPLSALLAQGTGSFTPGIVDGKVIRESVGTAIASGRFNHVPILNGVNHEEERIFTNIGLNVANGATIALPGPITADTYQDVIATTLALTPNPSKKVVAEYPLGAYGSPALAFSALSSDANFSCPTLALDQAAARHVPTYGYEFNDDTAPERYVDDALGPPYVATHQTELQYLFGLPNAKPATLSADQEALSTTMRAAWAQFAATGSPSTRTTPWPRFDAHRQQMLSLVAPTPYVDRTFAARHHCGFWTSLD